MRTTSRTGDRGGVGVGVGVTSSGKWSLGKRGASFMSFDMMGPRQTLSSVPCPVPLFHRVYTHLRTLEVGVCECVGREAMHGAEPEPDPDPDTFNSFLSVTGQEGADRIYTHLRMKQ